MPLTTDRLALKYSPMLLAALFSDNLMSTDSPAENPYMIHCAACHGSKAEGVDMLGVALANSSFVAQTGEDDMIAFLKVGRMSDDRDSITGTTMPGFADLSDNDLRQIIAYFGDPALQSGAGSASP